MEKLNRNDKIYLDKDKTRESCVNEFLSCRDGIVEVYEYRAASGYGNETRLFLCINSKHESIALVRQTRNGITNEWDEEYMYFDSDSFVFLEALIAHQKTQPIGGVYSLVRDYNTEI